MEHVERKMEYTGHSLLQFGPGLKYLGDSGKNLEQRVGD